jgi:hypothetical protein
MHHIVFYRGCLQGSHVSHAYQIATLKIPPLTQAQSALIIFGANLFEKAAGLLAAPDSKTAQIGS